MNPWCVPYAIGKVTGKTSDQIADLLQAEGGKKVTKVRSSAYIPLLKELGVNILAQIDKPHMTVARWARLMTSRGDERAWLIRGGGHLMVFFQDKIYDNMRPLGSAPMIHPAARTRIKNAWKVDAWSDLNPYREIK